MKPLLATLATALLVVTTASADWVIESKIESPQINSTSITKIKGDKVRSDIASGPMGAMSSIIDSTTGDSIQLLHAQKMAMKTSAAQMKQAMEMAKQLSGAKDSTAPTKLQATGEKEKVGDYDCEVWTWADGNMSFKFWVAKNHPQAATLKEMDKKMRGGALGGMQAGPDTSLLPGPAIKTETTVTGVKTTMTILSVKEQAIDAKEFEVPAGYQSMSLPGAK
jgi:hypothetical protein